MNYIDLSDDTIAAISTPKGIGGIGIIRISGKKSLEILSKIFKSNIEDYSKIKNRYLNYGHIVDRENDVIIDEVLAVYMKGPKTYTGEDIVEINCHGGLIPLKNTLQLILKNGAIPAEPGEFTKRAFLNGRLDLTQAEAVMDVIGAKTEKQFDVALNQLQGKFSDEIISIRKKMVDLLVNLTVNIDYPDEDIEELTYRDLKSGIENVKDEISTIINGSKRGKIFRDGLKVAIIGKPNVGKSSLMNRLLNENRAIVTSIAGTTRDTIEETLNIRGIPVVLTDTAGIRETDDEVEKIGIEKSKIAFNEADLVIFIIDGSRVLDQEDKQILEVVNPEKTVILFNKMDLLAKATKEDLEDLVSDVKVIETSMESGKGIEQLEDYIEGIAMKGDAQQSEDIIITNLRQENLIESAYNSLVDALESVEIRSPMEFIEIDVNAAYGYLGEVIGEEIQGDIIDEVFARFCLGK